MWSQRNQHRNNNIHFFKCTWVKKLILRLCYSENFAMLGSVKPAEDWPRFHCILTWLTNANKYVIFFHAKSTCLSTKYSENEISLLDVQQYIHTRKSETRTVLILVGVYLTDFLETNLTKFAVIWMKRRQKEDFLAGYTAPKSRYNEGNEKGEERRRKKKRWLHS